MRTAIRKRLIRKIRDVGDRVYEPQAAGPTTKKPYIVLRQGVDAKDTPWVNFRRIVEAWPYIARTTFKDVDALGKKIIKALDEQLLTTGAGEVFSCSYLGTAGDDIVDTEWDALTRGLRFAVLALQPVFVSERTPDDPWLNALVEWTQGELGRRWKVYKSLWPMGYARPAVMWRITDIYAEEGTSGIFQVSKKIVGHVIGSTPNQEIEAALQIVTGLKRDIKIPLSLKHRRYMTVEDPRVNYRLDALARGQVNVTLSRFTNRPYEAVIMKHVYLNKLDGGIQNE